VDFIWSGSVLDEIQRQFTEQPQDVQMIYPQRFRVQQLHEYGDQLVESVKSLPLDQVLSIPDEDQFETVEAPRAFGPLHIVRGEYTRTFGYLDGDEKWQKPRTDGKPFKSFQDDVIFRRKLETRGRIQSVDLRGIHRLRHTRTTYQSPKVKAKA